MNYAAGYKATFYGTLIDPASWAETAEVDLISGSVNNISDGLRQSATLQVRDFDRSQERWLRIYMDARQGDDIDHNPVFTGIVSAPKEDDEGTIKTNDLTCYSVLEPVNIPMTVGEYIARGVNAEQAIRRLLETTPAPVDIAPGAPAIKDYIIAEDNETRLTMLQKVLDVVNWQVVIHGDGTIQARPKPTEPAALFSADGLDILEQKITKTRDWFKAPNVLTATSGDAVAVARDEDPESPLSIPSRGREVPVYERDVKLSENEGLAEYAQRKLKEEQQVAEAVEYDRRYIPNLFVGDIVQANYDILQGVYEVKSQTINLTYNCQTHEQVERTDTAIEEDFAGITPKQKWNALVMPDDKYLLMPGNLKLLVPARRF